MNEFIKVDEWVKEIIVDPLSKEKLNRANGLLLSHYGRKYPIVNGIWDLRCLNNLTTQDQQTWRQGQQYYERWSLARLIKQTYQDYVSEIDGVREVYAEIPIEGRCLDVGGHQGRLRVFLSPDQQYVSCDPFINLFNGISRESDLVRAYPCLLEPVNFICCDAEFLPFQSSCFQTVHMRSVLDHFLNPELALNEAYRVLDDKGYLVIGLYVDGGKNGNIPIEERIKRIVKKTIESIGIRKYKDYHIWHPTFQQLTNLVTQCGFEITQGHWQKANNSVCYLKCHKRRGLQRNA